MELVWVRCLPLPAVLAFLPGASGHPTVSKYMTSTFSVLFCFGAHVTNVCP